MAPDENAARTAQRIKAIVEPQAAAGGYMDHEPGNPAVRVTRESVTCALHAAGLGAGDTVLFHSSLSSMGTVVGGGDAEIGGDDAEVCGDDAEVGGADAEVGGADAEVGGDDAGASNADTRTGGADTVIDGFLDAVGPTGTVAVPTLCSWQALTEKLRVWRLWNVAETPTYCGLIPETFRRRPNARRSNHYTHSVSAIGARAEKLTADHGVSGPRESPWGPGAFAAASPWQRLYDWNAFCCLIGVNCQRLTLVHFVETHLVHRALARAAPKRRDELLGEVRGWTRTGVWPGISTAKRLVAEEIFAERGLLGYGKIGSARLRHMRIQPVVDEWIALAERDPAYWCSDGFVKWLDRL